MLEDKFVVGQTDFASAKRANRCNNSAGVLAIFSNNIEILSRSELCFIFYCSFFFLKPFPQYFCLV
jgi:hypothetical protein